MITACLTDSVRFLYEQEQMKMRKKVKKIQGFTLIEVLIVMVIIGLLAALVGPKMFGKTGKAKQKAAKSQISLFETAIDTYRLDMGRFPADMKDLREKPRTEKEEKKWEGPYLPKEIPPDPWGNPYEYKSPGEHGPYDIISYGADGSPGGEGENEDIVSWKNIGE
jgi:general secretion pathway protein G